MNKKSFNTCLLVSALASSANAQLFLNLETDKFSWERHGIDEHSKHQPIHKLHEHVKEKKYHAELDHAHDVEEHFHDEDRLRHDHMHFREVHHPLEDLHYDSFGDHYHHTWPTSSWQPPRQSTDFEFHPHRVGDSSYSRYSNKMPIDSPRREKGQQGQKEAYVQKEEDPTICFVKAYARKPIGVANQKGAAVPNGIPSEYFNDDNFSDSDDMYYDEEDDEYENTSEDEGDGFGSSEDDEDEEETSSNEEDDSEQNELQGSVDYLNMPQDIYKHAQFFDLGQPQKPEVHSPTEHDGLNDEEETSSFDDEYDSEEEDESSEDDEYGNPVRRPRHRRARRARGHGRGGRKTGRHPTAKQRQKSRKAHASPLEETKPEFDDSKEDEPIAHHQDLFPHPAGPHDRHASPPSVRRQKKQRKSQRGGQTVPSGKRKQRGQQRRRGAKAQQQKRQAKQPRGRKQLSGSQKQQRRRKQRHRPMLSNDEVMQEANKGLLYPDITGDSTCPKFFEKTEIGCEKPLSLWRGTGQVAKCYDCQKCEGHWYPKCPQSFAISECDVCVPVCPDGLIDHDGTCVHPGQKGLIECSAGQSLIDGECYRQCPGQTSEFDILCFGLCPMDMHKCGHTLCLKADQQCPEYVADKAIALDSLVDKYKRKDQHGSRLINLSQQSLFPFPECQ